MTTPAEPDTGAGAAPDTGSAPEQPTTDQQPDTAATDTVDWEAEAGKWKALARKHETTAKANRKALDDATRARAGEPTIEDLRKQLTERDETIAGLQDFKAETAYKEAVRTAAGDNLDAAALLDSDSFRRKVQQELGDDGFDDDDLLAAVRKVAKSKDYAGNPRFARTLGAARSGGEFHGGPSSPASIDQQIAEATKNRDFTKVIALKRLRSSQPQ